MNFFKDVLKPKAEKTAESLKDQYNKIRKITTYQVNSFICTNTKMSHTNLVHCLELFYEIVASELFC